MSRLLDMVREMAMVVARLEERLKEAKTLVKAFVLDCVLTLPLPPAQFLHIPTVPRVVGHMRS